MSEVQVLQSQAHLLAVQATADPVAMKVVGTADPVAMKVVGTADPVAMKVVGTAERPLGIAVAGRTTRRLSVRRQ
jgi:hypothetical protein